MAVEQGMSYLFPQFCIQLIGICLRGKRGIRLRCSSSPARTPENWEGEEKAESTTKNSSAQQNDEEQLASFTMAVYFTNHRLVRIWRQAENSQGSCRLWRWLQTATRWADWQQETAVWRCRSPSHTTWVVFKQQICATTSSFHPFTWDQNNQLWAHHIHQDGQNPIWNHCSDRICYVR